MERSPRTDRAKESTAAEGHPHERGGDGADAERRARTARERERGQKAVVVGERAARARIEHAPEGRDFGAPRAAPPRQDEVDPAPLPAALERFSTALQRFARGLGKENLYHETITWTYLFLVHQRMRALGPEVGWDEFAERNPDLFLWRPGVVDRFYRPETLDTELARRIFVMPDRLLPPPLL